LLTLNRSHFLYYPEVILSLLLLQQVGPCSVMFLLVLPSHGTRSGGLVQSEERFKLSKA
jgi:hypothetical protein